MPDRPIKEMASLATPRRPYAGAPPEVRKEIGPTDSTAVIARAYFDSMEAVARSYPTLVPGTGQTPRQFESEVRRHERRVALIRYKQSIFPMVQLYMEAMEASPALSNINSMAAACILGIYYTDDWRHVTKLLAQLGSIFGHATANVNVTRRLDPGSIDARLDMITARHLVKVRQVGLTEVFEDAESPPRPPEAVRDDRGAASPGDNDQGEAGASRSC